MRIVKEFVIVILKNSRLVPVWRETDGKALRYKKKRGNIAIVTIYKKKVQFYDGNLHKSHSCLETRVNSASFPSQALRFFTSYTKICPDYYTSYGWRRSANIKICHRPRLENVCRVLLYIFFHTVSGLFVFVNAICQLKCMESSQDSLVRVAPKYKLETRPHPGRPGLSWICADH